MSMHDPGWDDAGFDSGGRESGWSGGGAPDPQHGAPNPQHGGAGGGPPRWQQPRVVASVGALALVVIVVLAVLVIKNRSGSNDTAASSPPSSVSTSPSTSPKTSPKTSPTPTRPAFISLDDWDAKADAVCTSYKAKLLTANQNVQTHHNWKGFITVLAAQIRAFERIPPPTKQADVVQKWLDDLHGALSDADAHNATAFDASVLPADTYAGKMGMHVCNYGH